jgi:thymidylate kinase
VVDNQEPPIPIDRNSNFNILEVTGISGAGKTSWLRSVIDALAENGICVETNHPDRFHISSLPRMGHLPVTAQNVGLELAGTLSVLGSMSARRFVATTLRETTRAGVGPREGAAYMRGVVRRTGTLLRWRAKGCRGILDEGTVHTLHSVLVGRREHVNLQAVAEFCERVPLPNAIVHLDVSSEIAIARSMTRPDPPFQGSEASLERYIHVSKRAFELVLSHPRIRPLVWRVKSDGERNEVLRWVLEMWTSKGESH